MTLQTDSLLVTKAEIGQLYEFSALVSDDKINPHIRTAQLKNLRPLLCQDFYDEILADFDGDTVTGKIQTFLEKYIKPYLASEAFADYLVWSNKNAYKTGFHKFTEQNTQNITEQELGSLITTVQENAKVFKGDLLRYLKTNVNDSEFSTYKSCNDVGHSQNIQYSKIGVDRNNLNKLHRTHKIRKRLN